MEKKEKKQLAVGDVISLVFYQAKPGARPLARTNEGWVCVLTSVKELKGQKMWVNPGEKWACEVISIEPSFIRVNPIALEQTISQVQQELEEKKVQLRMMYNNL